jgi:endonuclease YncB( thermonuclease family)
MSAMPKLVRLYPARLIRPIDGDTACFAFSLGFGVEIAGTDGKGVRSRFAGINCPEIGTDVGKMAAAYTANFLREAAATGAYYPLLIESHALDNYGRPLVTIWNRATGECLNDALIVSNNAAPMKLSAQLAVAE